MKIFFLIMEGSVFWPAKSKSDVYFCQPEPETLDNSEKQAFSEILRVSELN